MKKNLTQTLPGIALTLLWSLGLFPVLARAEISTRELMDNGFRSFGNSEYQDAVNDFEQVLAIEPNNEEARMALEKTKEELVRHGKNAKNKHGNGAFADFPDIDSAKMHGEACALIDSLWDVLKSDPKNKKALKALDKIRTEYEDKLSGAKYGTAGWNFDQGLLTYMDKDWSRSFDFFQEARRLQPDDEAADNNGQRAKEKLLAIIREEQAGFYRESAKAFSEQSQYKEALYSWLKVIDAIPGDPEARRGIAQCEASLSRLNNKVHSNDVMNSIETALELYANRKWHESLREWQKIQRMDPTIESAPEYIAKINAKLSSIAKENSREAPGPSDSWRAPKKAPAAALVTSLTPTEDNFPEAIKNMEEILRRDPSNIKVAQVLEKAKARQQELADKYYKDGLIAYSQGKVAAALRQWEIVLRIDPKHAKAHQAIVKAQAESGT